MLEICQFEHNQPTNQPKEPTMTRNQQIALEARIAKLEHFQARAIDRIKHLNGVVLDQSQLIQGISDNMNHEKVEPQPVKRLILEPMVQEKTGPLVKHSWKISVLVMFVIMLFSIFHASNKQVVLYGKLSNGNTIILHDSNALSSADSTLMATFPTVGIAVTTAAGRQMKLGNWGWYDVKIPMAASGTRF